MHAQAPTMPADLRAILASLGVEPQGERPRSERVLERLLDLNRCVALGSVLDEPPSMDAAEPAERAALAEAELARLRVFEQRMLVALRDLRARIDARFDAALAGARGVPDAAALHALLVEGGTPASRAARIAPRYVAIVDATLEPALKELLWLRKDLQQALQQGNPETRKLAALDLVLDAIFRTELAASRTQLEAEIAAAFDARLRAACEALAPAASVDALRPWFGPRGAVGQFLRDARRACHALLDLEWSALMGLLQAGVQAERSLFEEPPRPEENDES
jgi:hypothetical protein